MDKDRILVVEDDDKTSTYLKTYFEWLGYEVLIAGRGSDALDICRLEMPNVVILDVLLPDVNGYEVCRTLRNNSRTCQIPVIFLSQRSKRNDIIAAFELGADDYVTKPFDIEELKLRVEGAIRRCRHEALMHPVTKLPASELILEQLKVIKDSPEPWTLLYFSLENIDVFEETSSFEVADEILVKWADILRQTVDTHGTPHDFIGQPSDSSFIVITIPETASAICKTVTEKFGSNHKGTILAVNSVELLVGAVSSYDGPFTDIRQITKALARLGQQQSGCPEPLSGLQPRPADIDYYHQLTEQVSLWQTEPELAQTLIEVERLTAARVPDMHKVEVLLDLAAKAELPAEVFNELQTRQHLCSLVCENLKELQYKIRRYQEFKPTSLIKNLEYTLTFLPKFQITVSSAARNVSELMVALPELKLQQVIYNTCRWLLYNEEKTRLLISLEVTKDMASLIFTSANLKEDRLETSTLLKALHQNKPGAIYGYLAHKIVSRYRGRLTSNKAQVSVSLPLAEYDELVAYEIDIDTLPEKIKVHRVFLDKQQKSLLPAHIADKAANLVDSLARDLLIEIEAMVATLNTSPAIDVQTYPWSAIERHCRFFRLLTMDLQKYRPMIPAPVNLKSLLENIKPMLAHRMINHDIIIESEVVRPVINTDQMRLSQIFVNLALYALESMPEWGILKFHIRQAGRHHIVEVIDNGAGISPEDLPHIFEPYFTVRGVESGVRLHNVKTYIEQLNGQIEVSSKVGEGTTFVVKLPPSWETGYF